MVRVLFGTLLVLIPIALPAREPALKEAVGELPGAYVISGGGPIPDSVRDRFLELAGGKNARLVVIADGAGKAGVLDLWKNQGAASVTLLQARKREDADADFAKPLADATGAWLEADDVARLPALYRGTAVEKELRKLLERGGALGTSSEASAALGPVLNQGGTPSELVPGLGLLPGAAVEAHALKRNRADRLLDTLAQRPGFFGLGVDEQTAVIIKGRAVTVLGSSHVLVCQSASEKRHASVQILKNGDKADLIALSRAAVARTQAAFPPEKPPVPNVPKGALVIGGGGGMPNDVVERFIELTGGPDALIVLVPTALEDPIPKETVEEKILRRSGARNLKVLHTRKRSEADREEFAAPLREARGVWFSGGRQWRFVDSYEGTATERAFRAVLARGGVIGGSSAGASIQADYMPRGDPLGNHTVMAEGYERGFNYLPGVAIDQHFFTRKRQADMAGLVGTFPQLVGIGIDENTAVVVRGSVLEVMGKSKVAVFDHRKGGSEKDYEELSAGARFDLAIGKRVEDKKE